MEKFIDTYKNSTVNNKISSTLPTNFKNIMFYGSPYSNKYDCALHLLMELSPKQLSYEKKIIVDYNDNEYIYRMSDIHIEINFEFLGCIAKNLWAAIYQQINQMVGKRKFYILCKNFSSINNELMENFYTYINDGSSNLHFIFLVDNIACIPNEIVECSTIYPVKRISKTTTNEISNSYNDEIIRYILTKNIDVKSLRNTLYDLLIYQIDVYNLFFIILKEINNHDLMTDQKMIKLLNEQKKMLKLFNNNYRSIYHLENFVITIKHILYS